MGRSGDVATHIKILGGHFNSDAAIGYCATFPNPSQNIQGCGSAAQGNLNSWGTVTIITTPRYARFQVTFDF